MILLLLLLDRRIFLFLCYFPRKICSCKINIFQFSTRHKKLKDKKDQDFMILLLLSLACGILNFFVFILVILWKKCSCKSNIFHIYLYNKKLKNEKDERVKKHVGIFIIRLLNIFIPFVLTWFLPFSPFFILPFKPFLIIYTILF